MNKEEMWNKFNLAENNLDQGAGILYCLKYDEGRIKSHQESIVNALKLMGIKLEDSGELIGARCSKKLDKSKQNRVYMLFEELSCLNEAMEYLEVGFNKCNSIGQLREKLESYCSGPLEKEDISNIYGVVTITIPQIVRDLRIAEKQNKLLSTSDKKDLTDLIDFAETKNKQIISLLCYPLILYHITN